MAVEPLDPGAASTWSHGHCKQLTLPVLARLTNYQKKQKYNALTPDVCPLHQWLLQSEHSNIPAAAAVLLRGWHAPPRWIM
jgi:hypothetical protein